MAGISNLQILACTILSCSFLFGISESATTLSAEEKNVPEGESFRLTCITRNELTNGLSYRNELYKVEENGVRIPVPKSELVMAGETHHTKVGDLRATIITVFTLDATEASAGRYGCLPIPISGTLPTTFSDRMEVTLRVCLKPHIELSQTGADPIHVRGRENCNYKGELTWRVNGRQAPRNQTPEAVSSLVIEGDDDTLEIRSAECGDAENICTVTAVFTYITADRRVSRVTETLHIPDCCLPSYASLTAQEEINGGTATEEALPVTFQPHRSDVLVDRPQQESERLALEKDVLKYKLEALPLQIKFLKRLIRNQSAGREMEQLADM